MWFVSRHRSNRYRLKQALLGVIAGSVTYVAKNPRKNRSLSGKLFDKIIRPENGSHLPTIYICKYFFTNFFNQFFNTLKKKHHIAQSSAINTLYIFFIIINVNQVKINFTNKL